MFQYDIHKNALKSQFYYPDLIELQNAPLISAPKERRKYIKKLY